MAPKTKAPSKKSSQKKKQKKTVERKAAEAALNAWHQRYLLDTAALLQVPSSTVDSALPLVCAAKPCGVSPVELHSHSHYSDGRLSPSELVYRAARRGVRCLSLTDHDTFSGVEEAQKAGLNVGVAVIPGVEISSYLVHDAPDGSEMKAPLHLLGYFDACAFQRVKVDLEEYLKQIQEGRVGRVHGILADLKRRGVTVCPKRVFEVMRPSVSPSRNHIAQVLVEQGHVADPREAFSRLLQDDEAFVGRGADAEVSQVVELIRGHGGVAVLAHPWSVKSLAAAPLLRALKAHGVQGVEVFRGGRKMEDYDALARDLELMRLGGSDYHAKGHSGEADIGDSPTSLSEFLKMTMCLSSQF